MSLDLKLIADIVLTKGQEDALDMCRALAAVRGPTPRVARLCGFAGTGKSTLLRIIAKTVGGVVVIAPTGKAALRVTEATGLAASTIHRWLYKPRPNTRTGEVEWTLKPDEEIVRPASGIIVIDEASMVDEALWNDIYTVATALHCNILCVGDPFQLPPVSSSRDGTQFGLLGEDFKGAHATVMLTEVLRQAAESPIIRASMLLRAGKWYEAVCELPRVSEANLIQTAHDTLTNGVVLCHKNTSRQHLNREIRKLKGLGDDVTPGEPLLVLKNNYVLNKMNGETTTFLGWEYLSKVPYDIYDPYKKEKQASKVGKAQVDCPDGSIVVVGMATEEIAGRLDKVGSGSINKVCTRLLGADTSYLSANYGYCLTTHKAQGNEWDEVLVIIEPSVTLDSLEGRRFAYTGVTRGRNKVSLCFAKVT